MQIDYSDCKNITAKKNKLRGVMTADLLNYYKNLYGEDNVSQIGVNRIAVATGDTIDRDGTPQEICAEIVVIAKSWEDSDGKQKRVAFDRFEEEYYFKLDQKIKGVDENADTL